MPLAWAGADVWPDDFYKDCLAPMIRQLDAGKGTELLAANYSMRPKRFMPPDVRFYTMNTSVEDVGTRKNYAPAWRAGKLSLLPTHHYYEWMYPDGEGRPERWAIGMADGLDFCVAEIWRDWTEEDGATSSASAQLTTNADEHPLLSQFHPHDKEKRGVVILPRDSFEDWLTCRAPEVAWSMLQLLPANQLKAWPAPKPAKEKAVAADN